MVSKARAPADFGGRDGGIFNRPWPFIVFWVIPCFATVVFYKERVL